MCSLQKPHVPTPVTAKASATVALVEFWDHCSTAAVGLPLLKVSKFAVHRVLINSFLVVFWWKKGGCALRTDMCVVCSAHLAGAWRGRPKHTVMLPVSTQVLAGAAALA